MQKAAIIKVYNGRSHKVVDKITEEGSLSIDLIFGPSHNRCHHNFSRILRSPGHDRELCVGLLFSLGIIDTISDIVGFDECIRMKSEQNGDARITIELDPQINFMPHNFFHAHERNSSCGFCGNVAQAPMRTKRRKKIITSISQSIFFSLPQVMRDAQKTFHETGGTHCAALFDQDGQLIACFEDIGRHNALDKLIGCQIKKSLALDHHILLMSSRASYEIIAKAHAANIAVVASLGAVSSLALKHARENQITLIGFLNSTRMNIYTHPERLL